MNAVSARLFRRALGLVFFAAFLSFWVQADGLIGRRGILPSAARLEEAHREAGAAAYRLLPTLCWLAPGDGMVHALCAAGAICSLILVFDVAPAACLFLLWAFYLSLATVAQPFLDFQWDGLLLESALLALFLAPWRGGKRASPPPRSGILLLRWLLFRLMFSSGVVKLASGDPAWRSLTALTHHYETQPLPTRIGWYAHQLPPACQRLSVLAMVAIELVVPFFLFAPRRLRHAAAAAIALLQVAIALTGNYAFFNFLTIALCLLAFDDRALARLRPRGEPVPPPPAAPRPAALRALRPALAGAAFGLSLVPMAALLRPRRWPAPVLAAYGAVEPLRSFNSYGLFAVMTMTRPEILIEGSRDGETWIPYEFRWKPGDPNRAPAFVAPHQPRLDWQMWFAALGEERDNPWFLAFLRRLLEGSPPVLRLLARDPFPGGPPRYVRATLYDYRFTDFAARRRTGAWWVREPIGPYGPVVTLGPAPDRRLEASPDPAGAG